MPRQNKARVLVTGATGMQGGAAVQALLREGHHVTAFVRDPSSGAARALAAQGVALAAGNMDDTALLDAASAGHDVVFSMQMPALDDAGTEERQARNIVAAARRAGVAQIIHTSVSATGWRARHPDICPGVLKTYWDGKEGAEDAVRRGGFDAWTIFKPAFYMENFIPPKVVWMFPGLAQGELLTASSPQTPLALIAADDFGAAVAAAVADPEKFHGAEVELAGDAPTFSEIAAVLSKAARRDITAVFLKAEELDGRIHEGMAASQVWIDHVGYSARPHHAAHYGLSTTTLQQWAERQDWHTTGS
ncbi:NmrA family NAD(P)-binding protein [Streptomyces europaeiscabiei]